MKLASCDEKVLPGPVGMSSRLRKGNVAAKFYELAHRLARARHSEAAAACSSVVRPGGEPLLRVRVLSRPVEAQIDPALPCDKQAAPENVCWCRWLHGFESIEEWAPQLAIHALSRSREPPAKWQLGDSTVICAIISGFRQSSKAAPLQAGGYDQAAAAFAMARPGQTVGQLVELGRDVGLAQSGAHPYRKNPGRKKFS